MAEVDPADDAIVRHIVRHYAYDPTRRERRHQIVGAFDCEKEAKALFRRLSDNLRQRKEEGQTVDPQEYYSAMTLPAGYRKQQQAWRVFRAATKHGVSLEEVTARIDLPEASTVSSSRRAPRVAVAFLRARRFRRPRQRD